MTDHSQQGFATRAIHLAMTRCKSRGALSPPLPDLDLHAGKPGGLR